MAASRGALQVLIRDLHEAKNSALEKATSLLPKSIVNIGRGVLRTLSNIYGGDFFAKMARSYYLLIIFAEKVSIDVMFFAFWCHWYNLKNVKTTHGRVLILVKLQAEPCNFTKINTHSWVFLTFINCANGTKSHKASQIFDRVLHTPLYK